MIKNFIYLDEEKMYSLSSQLFEGITEYVLKESLSEKENNEEQKGPVGSGRILGDILKRSDRHSEKKFLNDYSYNLFENKLIEDERVLYETELDGDQSLRKSFIKISSKLIFNDMNTVQSTLKNYNAIGQAIAHISNAEDISNFNDKKTDVSSKTSGRNKKNKIN